MKRVVIVAALAFVLALGGFVLRAKSELAPAASAARPELFVIERGDSMAAVSQRLERAGLVRSAPALRLLARFRGVDSQLHVGEYELSAHQRPAEILDIVTSGRVKTWPVTLPEGSRLTEVAARLAAARIVDAGDFVRVASDPELVRELGVPGRSLEGYLYPDTYALPRGLDAEEVAATLVRQFERVWASEIEPRLGASQLDKAEIVTLASIVEKETAVPEERPLIAAVFLNRLARGMRLETDPTVIYGIADFDGNLRKLHLQDETNPYNTYRIAGLPPGPIANPGVEALRAVVEPSETDALYFVSRNDGTHVFSATYAEHLAAVDRYQKRRSGRTKAKQ